MTVTEQERERTPRSFTFILSLPQWHCKIGRMTLKRGVTMHVPFNCFDLFA